MPSVDRLSALPDNIISHILSFLPIKISVSTSILSRRWRFMWAHFPNLDFNNLSRDHETRFWNIIDRVMSNPRLESINTFRLKCNYSDLTENKFDEWFAGRSINNLILCSRHDYLGNMYVLPRTILTCKTLVELKFTACPLPNFSGNDDMSFPRLKKIHLNDVHFVTDETLPKLLCHCPVLEDLSIVNCWVVNCYISSPTIERLLVSIVFTASGNRELRINAPALEYLQLFICATSCVSACALPSLIEANIEFLDPFSYEDELFRLSVLGFVDRLCKVKRLKLSINVPLPYGIRSIPRFDNCTRLELDVNSHLFVKLLEAANNLEVLVIFRDRLNSRIWEEPKQVPRCLLVRLAMVRVDEFECREPEFSMARYFLKNAKVLKRMEVHTSEGIDLDLTTKFNALQKIALFTRGSNECELAFS
ncbi:FBD-associated F-box protein [Striga hermonthica]|uniref:FBD-associated F-box protein n=1 Tax=Striga hermonthica TaxID=68872 RepID=A0A9N7MXD7_STRHE|nr:FBD-associated F-box protein [Striga hermonthica]